MFLIPYKRGLNKREGGGSEILLKSNGNIAVYCAPDKHQKTHSIQLVKETLQLSKR